jgi:hypothetical protein
MTFWVPRPARLLGSALVLASVALAAKPAAAIPIVDVGAGVGAAVQLSGNGPALDLTGNVNLRGLQVSGQYYQQFAQTQLNYWQGAVGYNVSPVPMLSVSPALGVASWKGSIGPLGQVTGSFSPFLLPVSVEASAGATYVQSTVVLPYSAGIKLSLIPFTSFNLRYRGWAGSSPDLGGMNGPEIGIEFGI